jgi:hypothetical protein
LKIKRYKIRKGIIKMMEIKSNKLILFYYLQVEEIRHSIDLVQQNVEEVKKKHSEILSNPTNDPS